MSIIYMRKVAEFLDGKDVVSIPQLQQYFGYSYAEAKTAMSLLVKFGAVTFDSGIIFKVMKERLARLLECQKQSDAENDIIIRSSGGRFDERALAEARADLERRKAELLARMKNDTDAEEKAAKEKLEKKDDASSAADPMLEMIEKAGITVEDIIATLELALNSRGNKVPFNSTSLSAKLKWSLFKADVMIDFLLSTGFLSAEKSGAKKYIVNITPEELKMLRKTIVDDD